MAQLAGTSHRTAMPEVSQHAQPTSPSDVRSARPSEGPAALAALDAQLTAALDGGDRQSRRGPFRPEAWLNTRQRGAARLAVHYFRAIDVLLVLAVTLLCAWAVSPTPLAQAELSLILPFAAGAMTVLGLARSIGLYRFRRGDRDMVRMAAIAAVSGAGGVVCALCALILGTAASGIAPWSAYVVWTGLMLITLQALHLGWGDLIERWRRSGALTPNVVIVGATRHAERLIRDALDHRGLNILGVFDDRMARSPSAVLGVPVLGPADALLSHPMTPFVDRIVLAIDPSAETRVRELSSRLSVLPNGLTLLVEPRNEDERNAALDKLAGAPLASLDGPPDPDRRAFNKRLQDATLGAIAAVLLAPVMLLIALAVRLDSPGPVLFRQRRHGFNQEEIVVWKFRTMRHEAADATASRQVTHDDERVTRVGRVLRAASLDELPQLLNVLRGEMSLVGPRPHAIGMKTGRIESSRLVAEYAHRHRIKPGMTGWAAIHGSRGPLHTPQDVRRRVRLDIEYVERQSFWLDLWIMAVTVPVLLGDRAAIR